MIYETSTPQELNQLVKEWITGEHIQHLWLGGTPGTGKSHTVREALKDAPRTQIIKGASPLAFYKQLYAIKNADLILLDDADGTIHNKKTYELLKELLEDKDERTISWDSNRTGKDKDVPKSFTTRARICVITNEYGAKNTHTEALINRCFAVWHAPSFDAQVALALKEGLITKGMAKHFKQEVPPDHISLRTLMRYNSLRRMGKDWEAQYAKDKRA